MKYSAAHVVRILALALGAIFYGPVQAQTPTDSATPQTSVPGFITSDSLGSGDNRGIAIVNADVIDIVDRISEGTGGPVTVGSIQRIPQDIPVAVLQSAWDTALGICRTPRSNKAVNYCAANTYTPTQAQCETGSVTLPAQVTITPATRISTTMASWIPRTPRC